MLTYRKMFRGIRKLLYAAVSLAAVQVISPGEEAALSPGVAAIFKSGTATDTVILPNFWLWQPDGEPPSSFLPSGEYVVEFAGLVSVDLRGIYSFQVELNGELAVEVNGKQVLRAVGRGGLSDPGKSFRLNKGTNVVLARFTPPKGAAAQLRLYWIPRKGVPAPIPQEAISHLPNALTKVSAELRRGRNLFAQLRCAKCHETAQQGMPELKMDAPSFAGIGARLHPGWMAEWIENPRAERPQAKMPKLLHGPKPKEDARAISSYLATLTGSERGSLAEKSDPAAGKELFAMLRCNACHTFAAPRNDPTSLISLDDVARKFRSGALETFLLNPQAHYKWTGMPNFKLNSREAGALAAYLRVDEADQDELTSEFELIERGKMLTQTLGCLNCHALDLENRYEAPPLANLAATEEGCLADEVGGKAPDYNLGPNDRADLRQFLKKGLASLERDTLREFTLRQSAALNCIACHGKAEGFTPFDLLGEKLDPNWSGKFLAGAVPYKPRPWLPARMPAFPTRAESLAVGLAVLHGHPPTSPKREPVNPELAEIGRRLASADGGFSCTACHAIGPDQPALLFESPGVNLAYSGERLRESFFHRWMLNPLAVDPATKMPVYFDEDGRSPLIDVFDGDADQQIEALWHYLRSEADKLSREAP